MLIFYNRGENQQPVKDEGIVGEMDRLIVGYAPNEASYKAIGEFGSRVAQLPIEEVNQAYSQISARYPKYANEIHIGWAWSLSIKGRCPEALDKIKSISDLRDPFWINMKNQILKQCQSS